MGFYFHSIRHRAYCGPHARGLPRSMDGEIGCKWLALAGRTGRSSYCDNERFVIVGEIVDRLGIEKLPHGLDQVFLRMLPKLPEKGNEKGRVRVPGGIVQSEHLQSIC